jgi:hypothetical protein
MKKIIVLLLSLLTCFGYAQKVNLNNYLKGKVPVQNGSVVFEKTFSVPGKSKAEIYTNLLGFMQGVVKDSDHKDYSKMTLQDEKNGYLVSNIQELMYFKHKSWVTDCADFFYRILITCSDGEVNMKIQDISYNYENDLNIKAEKWITDVYALSKNGKTLRKDTGKFRQFTIDRVQQLMANAEQAAKE